MKVCDIDRGDLVRLKDNICGHRSGAIGIVVYGGAEHPGDCTVYIGNKKTAFFHHELELIVDYNDNRNARQDR